MLRTVQGSADSNKVAAFLHFNKPTKDDIKMGAKNLDLNKLMSNVGNPQFDFGTFKNAYDTDPRVKAMVKNFDKIGVEIKTVTDMEGDPSNEPSSPDKVSQMAKSAVDLKDL